MSEICEQLHEILRERRRFRFEIDYESIPKNGIYVVFEKGEYAHSGERIVRVGTHTGEKQLKSRMRQHFDKENKNRSIFRKNIGRCFLNEDESEYLETWNLDTTSRKNRESFESQIDKEFEKKIEEKVSRYIRENFSFCVLDVPEKSDRMYYEARLIGTISNCSDCHASDEWFGNSSPVGKIKKSGLWQTMQLYSPDLKRKELDSDIFRKE